MVHRISRLLLGKVSSLHTAAYVLGVFTILSSLLALMRDRLLAAIFGAGTDLDIYYAAFRIPDLLFVSVGSLVSISVLIPLLAEKNDDTVAERYELSRALTFFMWCILSVSIALWFLLPMLSHYIYKGFTYEEIESVVLLSRILLLSPILLGLSNIFGSVAQLYNRFVLYALSPILYNFGIIGGIILLAPRFGIRGVVVGVVLGALLHVVPQALFVYKKKLWPHLVSISFSYVRKLSVLSVGRTVALSLSHIVLLILVSIASFLPEGSITIFTFSYNLQSVIVSVFGVSYSLAAFSALSKLVAQGKWDEYVFELTSSVRQLLFWSIPAVVLLVILRAQIIRTVLGAGAFTWEDTRLTAASLAIFAFATVFQSLSLIFTRAFYSKGNTLVPLLAHVGGGVVAIYIAFFFAHSTAVHVLFDTVATLLKVSDLSYTVLILPTAFTIGALLTCLLLGIFILKEKMVTMDIRFLIEIGVASLIMGGVSYYGLIIFEPVFGTITLTGIFLQGLCAGLLGIVVGIGTLILLRNRDVQDMIFFLRSGKRKTPEETISHEATDIAP